MTGGGGGQKLSWLMAVISMVKCQWGIGMMAIPFMLQQAGLVVGCIQFALSMCLTVDVVHRLLDVRDVLQRRRHESGSEPMVLNHATGEALLEATDEHAAACASCAQASGAAAAAIQRVEDDYAGVIRQTLGPRAELLAIVSIMLSMFGSLVAYTLYIAENLTRFVSPYCSLPEWAWALICVAPWLASALADDVSFLAPFGAVGLACALGFEGVMIYDTAASLSWHEFTEWLRTLPVVRTDTLLIAVSIAAFCNEGVVIMALNVQASETVRPKPPGQAAPQSRPRRNQPPSPLRLAAPSLPGAHTSISVRASIHAVPTRATHSPRRRRWRRPNYSARRCASPSPSSHCATSPSAWPASHSTATASPRPSPTASTRRRHT